MARRRAPDQPPLPFPEQDPWGAAPIRAAVETMARNDGSDEQAERLDDYVNRLTGIGDYLQDKMLGGSVYGLEFTLRYLGGVDVENRWRGSDLGARIVETIPAEMTREGWEVSVQPSDEDGEEEETTDPPGPPTMDEFPAGDPPQPGGFGMPAAPEPPVGPLPEIDDEGPEIAEELEGLLDTLGLNDALLTALQYERAYGGSAIVIGADDGMDNYAKPLDEKNIKAVRFLNVLQGGREGEIVAWSYYRDPKAPKYGEPEIYMVRNIGVPVSAATVPGETGAAPGRKQVDPVFWIHESRLLIFPGTSVSRRARVQMRGWGDSIFTRVDEVLAQYSQTWGGIASLMQEFHQDVLAVDGNSQKMAGGDKASKGMPLTKRARAIKQTKSQVRMLVIDRLTETFTRQAASVAGVSEILQQFAMRLAAAADMPVALLFGQAPAGLNATGASDIRFFYDRIASSQRRVLVPRLKRLIKLIFLSKEGPTEGEEPARWNVKPSSLYQLSAIEESQLRKTDAETDHMRIADGVLSPEEVAASAYGGSEYSSERTIDIEGRQEMAAKDEADKAARAEQMMQQLGSQLGSQPGSPLAAAPGAPPPQKPGATDKVE